MENILIITLGNSEIQFDINELENLEFKQEKEEKGSKKYIGKGDVFIQVKKNRDFENWYLPVFSRESGEKIYNHFAFYRPAIKFPLIQPLIDDFIKKNIELNQIIWIYTDQKDDHYKKNDTIFFYYILKKIVNEIYDGNIEQKSVAVLKNVKDIDFQYREFKKKLDHIIKEETDIENIFLFAQGGIDQINQALTLQLLQKYKDKVHILQKAEQEEVKELEFPKLFLNDLTKQKVIKHINDYEFLKAKDIMLEDNWQRKLCLYVGSRLELRYDNLEKFDIINIPEEIVEIIKNDVKKLNTTQLKIQDYIHAYCIDVYNNRYNNAIQKLFTIYENLYRNIIDKKFEYNTMDFWKKKYENNKTENKEWIDFLKSKLGNEIIKYLKINNVRINNPNTLTYFRIIKYLFRENDSPIKLNEKEFNKFDGVFNRFRDNRNEIAHKLGNITKIEFDNNFNNPNKETFHKQLKVMAGISDEESIYDLSKAYILNSF